MPDPLDRRIKYEEEASGMSDRQLMETSYIEMRDLGHHVRVTINGKLRILWSAWTWCTLSFKVVGGAGTLTVIVLKIMGKI